MVISDINLSAPEQIELKGSFSVRPPKQQEIDEMLRRGIVSNELLTANSAAPANNNSNSATLKSEDLTLAQAAKMSKDQSNKNGVTGFNDDDVDWGAPFRAEALEAELQLKSAEKVALTSIYEGKLQMILPVKNFPANTSMQLGLPKTPNEQFFLLDCPLIGNLYELTLSQAEDLLLLKKNDLANGFFNHSTISNFQAKAMGVIAISKIIGTARCNRLHCICRCCNKIFHSFLQIVKHYQFKLVSKKNHFPVVF
jgi:hypothetical protein